MTQQSEVTISICVESDLVEARHWGRQIAEDAGLGGADLTLVATAISEVARNILNYAGEGIIRMQRVAIGGREGIKVEAIDEGPGIANLELAMTDGYSTGGGLGLGLPGSRRLMDEFEIASEVGNGTHITMIKWKRTPL